MSNTKTLFLIDAMSMIYRAYFALSKSPIINSKGLNTSAILGFANMLLDILKNEKPTHIGVAFDSAAPTFRHEEYEEYKAQRDAMPEDIAISIPYIKEMLNKMSIPTFAMDGFEADDIIGTLAKKGEAEGFTVYMMTSDKDFGQLVSDNIFIYRPGKQGKSAEKIGVKEVCSKYSIDSPTQLIDILGLWGDASDNIPGVPGIGEVKAKRLLQEYGSIENLIKNSDAIENNKLRELVKKYSNQAIFSKNLATIATDTPISFYADELKWSVPEPTEIMELFKELEFRTFSKRFHDAFYANQPEIASIRYGIQGDLFSQTNAKIPYLIPKTFDNSNYQLINNLDDFAKLIELLQTCKCFAFNTETSGLDPFTDIVIGISFCIEEGKAYYLAFNDTTFTLKKLSVFLREIFESPSIMKVAHDLKFDYKLLKKYGILVKSPCFDTMIAHYLVNQDVKHSLIYLSETYLSHKPIAFEDILPFKNIGTEQLLRVPIEIMKDYSCENADIALRLKNLLEIELKQNGLIKLFYDIEMPLVSVLAQIEEEGITINTEELAKFSMKLQEQLIFLENEIFKLSGTNFNLASPKQLGEVLFEKLAITNNPPKTKTKQYSTGEEVLLKFKDKHPIIPYILEHRTINKLKTTYVDALPKNIHHATGRIHSTINQTVTSTGRLSSSNPNLQNIPIRTELGQEIRKAFIPRNSNYLILSADYSQIELRIIAAMSQDENMIEDFTNGIDIHKATASRIYNIPIEEINSEHRRNAKTVNFGIIYGISGFGLSERLGISKKESDILIETYFIQYPKVKKFIDETVEFAKVHGFVETIKNRKRIIPNIKSSNAFVRGFAERSAINAPIQGSAADIIKVAMILIQNRIQEEQLKSRMILQIHDELLFDTEISEIEVMKQLVKEEMVTAFCFDVPIEIDINFGANWLIAH